MKFWRALLKNAFTRTSRLIPPPQAQLVAAFGEFTPQMQQDLDNARIILFLDARIAEIEADPDWQAHMYDTISHCVDMIDCSPMGAPPRTNLIRGAVNDMGPLRKLARIWANHPDFLPEWEAQ